MAISIQHVLPIVQEALPDVPPDQLLADVTEFAKANPNLSSLEALAALHLALKEKEEGNSSNTEGQESGEMNKPGVEMSSLQNVLGLGA